MIKPTPKEVEEYAHSIGFTSLDGGYFCDKFNANGWRLKHGLPMKDWQAVVRNWYRYEKRKDSDIDDRLRQYDRD